MGKYYLIIILIIFGCYLTAAQQEFQPYCFRFTWLGPLHDEESAAKVNCTTFVGVPCIDPKIVTENSTMPNTSLIWAQHKEDYSPIACPMKPGSVCLKYTYNFNNAIVNITYFCGKMIEDKTAALSSGCYAQKVDGHIIEACACRSKPGAMPCNSAINNTYSTTLILFVTLIFIYNAANF